MQDRLFAHNGVIGDLPALEAELGAEAMATVKGETDSERFFALITREIAAGGGDAGRAIVRAARWVAEHLPVYALNITLISATELWALRYPDTHELHLLEREAGRGHLHHRATPGEVRVHSAELAERPAVVVASEPMDDHPGWRALASGELLHVDAELKVTVRRVLEHPPKQLISLADLDSHAAASQAP
jgi:glutamine amidotransferase